MKRLPALLSELVSADIQWENFSNITGRKVPSPVHLQLILSNTPQKTDLKETQHRHFYLQGVKAQLDSCSFFFLFLMKVNQLFRLQEVKDSNETSWNLYYFAMWVMMWDFPLKFIKTQMMELGLTSEVPSACETLIFLKAHDKVMHWSVLQTKYYYC